MWLDEQDLKCKFRKLKLTNQNRQVQGIRGQNQLVELQRSYKGQSCENGIQMPAALEEGDAARASNYIKSLI